MPVITNNFLEECIDALFEETDLAILTPEQQAGYRPQFLTALETRIGNSLMPRLNPEQLDEFVRLIDNPNSTQQEWNTFWNQAVPNFEEEVKKVVSDFTKEMVESFA